MRYLLLLLLFQRFLEGKPRSRRDIVSRNITILYPFVPIVVSY